MGPFGRFRKGPAGRDPRFGQDCPHDFGDGRAGGVQPPPGVDHEVGAGALLGVAVLRSNNIAQAVLTVSTPPASSTGTVTAFLATSADPTALAADVTLSVPALYAGSLGQWVVRFPAAILTPSLLEATFANDDAFCILQASDGVRAVVPVAYAPSYVVEASG